jgi:hypothetical protein
VFNKSNYKSKPRVWSLTCDNWCQAWDWINCIGTDVIANHSGHVKSDSRSSGTAGQWINGNGHMSWPKRDGRHKGRARYESGDKRSSICPARLEVTFSKRVRGILASIDRRIQSPREENLYQVSQQATTRVDQYAGRSHEAWARDKIGESAVEAAGMPRSVCIGTTVVRDREKHGLSGSCARSVGAPSALRETPRTFQE